MSADIIRSMSGQMDQIATVTEQTRKFIPRIELLRPTFNIRFA